jgi:hypothetical protein|tara:strand:+ start:1501 stop:2127 length:627 start_codon:yes stop_codon:yes gene_type:complete
MLKKYKIILLQNSVPKKTLFTSNVKRTTFHKFHKFLGSKKPLFNRKYVKRKFCQFELAIFSKENNNSSVYRKDSLGKNVMVDIDIPNYYIMELIPYWSEEFIYDHEVKSRISLDVLIGSYLPKKNFKQVFSLNNKLIIQTDDNFKMFSLKNVSDCGRLLSIIKELFISEGRVDCLFVPDSSTAQRKQLYKLLEDSGVNRKFLYKQYTY